MRAHTHSQGPKAAATADVYKHSTYITYIAQPQRAAYNLAHTRESVSERWDECVWMESPLRSESTRQINSRRYRAFVTVSASQWYNLLEICTCLLPQKREWVLWTRSAVVLWECLFVLDSEMVKLKIRCQDLFLTMKSIISPWLIICMSSLEKWNI